MKKDTTHFSKRLEDLILNNLQNDQLSVPWLAERMSFSERQLRRLMKDQTGKTPTIFIREIRLAEGKKILEKGGFSVKEAAAAVGYQKASWFSAQYLLKYNENPKTINKSQ